MAELEALAPDLVLWDFGPNDLIGVWGTREAKDRIGPKGPILDTLGPEGSHLDSYRAVLEQLVRRSLSFPSQPAFLFISHHRPEPCHIDHGFNMTGCNATATLELQSGALEPIARHYGSAVVSYREVISPGDQDELSRFEDEVARLGVERAIAHMYTLNHHPAHVWWYVHQLIADCVAYAYAVEEAAMLAQPSNEPHAVSALPSPLFKLDLAQQLEPCEGGWLTSIALGQGSPTAIGQGWQRVEHELVEKQGWQFFTELSARANLTRQRSSSHRAARPSEPVFELLEPITFAVRFGAKPRMSLTWLRSYENFGRALFWLDDEREAVLNAYDEERRYREACPKLFAGDSAHAESLVCSNHASGATTEPYLLNGHWSDHSSQSYSRGISPWTRVPSRFNDSKYTPKELLGRMFFYRQVLDAPIATEGIHHVSFAMLAPRDGDEDHGRGHFKLLEVNTC